VRIGVVLPMQLRVLDFLILRDSCEHEDYLHIPSEEMHHPSSRLNAVATVRRPERHRSLMWRLLLLVESFGRFSVHAEAQTSWFGRRV
jgi:hypothetical protein